MRSLFLALTLLAAQAAAAESLLLTAAHLLDVRDGSLIDNAAVLVEDGRIASRSS